MVASAQVTLLMLTARKSDCELGISLDSMHKMQLTREQSELSKEYYSKLQAKNICFYANGQYQKMNYSYLMGGMNGADYTGILQNSSMLKSNNNMILADYKGQVVLSDYYAGIITSVLGSSAMDTDGRGSTFSQDRIPEMLKKMHGFEEYTVDEIKNGVEHSSFDSTSKKTLTGEDAGQGETDNTSAVNESLEKLLNFYLPIFKAAAANGWTTEYNKEMALNEGDYISDALVTGTFQLEYVNDYGNYDEGTSLTYFITSGAIETRTDSSEREEITAWYNAEKERIAEKENLIDIHMSDLSTELEAINTEIQSIQSFIDDGVQSVFDWGNG